MTFARIFITSVLSLMTTRSALPMSDAKRKSLAWITRGKTGSVHDLLSSLFPEMTGHPTMWSLLCSNTYIYTRKNSICAVDYLIVLKTAELDRNRSSIAHRSTPSHSWSRSEGESLTSSSGSEDPKIRWFEEQMRLVKIHRSSLDRFISDGRATESSCRARWDMYHMRGDWRTISNVGRSYINIYIYRYIYK